VLPFSPRWARAYLELVEGMLLNGDYGEASDLCEQVLDSFPTFAPAAVGLLQAGALMGNSTLAERGARRAWQLRDSLSVRDREFVAVFLDLSPEYPQPSTHSQFVETSEALITSYLSEATAATAVGDVEGAVRAYLRYLSLLSHRTDLDPALMSDIDRARTELARPNERQ
jgi:hypothetical protein